MARSDIDLDCLAAFEELSIYKVQFRQEFILQQKKDCQECTRRKINNM